MITILHGENTFESRQRLNQIADLARASGQSVIRLESGKLSAAELEQALGSVSLFGTQQLVVIETLHSLPTSSRKKELLAMVAAASQQPDIVLWEKRSLTATMLKKFPQAKAEEFAVSKTLFKWLDSLNGQGRNKREQLDLLTQTLNREDAYFCFVMLCRQIRMLIEVRESGTIKGAPFMVRNLQKQASTFSQSQLLTYHTQLLTLDSQLKTSTQTLDLTHQLELFSLTR